MIGSFFSQFFHSAVEKAHDRGGLDQALTFQLQDDFQHAMGAWVLRSHVEEEFFGPERWKRFAFRMLGIDFINRSSLVFELCHDRAVVLPGRLYRVGSSKNSNVSRQPFPRSGKSLRRG